VIVDPPALGLSAGTRAALLTHAPATLVYVSCNPATLARDLQALQARYEIIAIVPLDMFPQTAEIECAVHLRATEKELATSSARHRKSRLTNG
ncbi:MAG: hypothetical protein M3Y86_10840, partial [Verrucomicrobiota bacterium]|nr:hypothetical protein [Verrucomicrobiota bacterium]